MSHDLSSLLRKSIAHTKSTITISSETLATSSNPTEVAAKDSKRSKSVSSVRSKHSRSGKHNKPRPGTIRMSTRTQVIHPPTREQLKQQQEDDAAISMRTIAADAIRDAALIQIEPEAQVNVTHDIDEPVCNTQNTSENVQEIIVNDLMSSERKTCHLNTLLADADTDLQQVRSLCWTGIPTDVRAVLWMVLLGIVPSNRARRETALQKRVQEYSSFVAQHFGKSKDGASSIFTQEQFKALNQIDLDLPRTQPQVQMYHLDCVQRSLRRVLAIYALRHPATGYVQGMNDLVTPFFYVFVQDIMGSNHSPLTITDESLSTAQWNEVEANSFWCVSRLMEGIQDHYTQDQPGIQRKLVALEELITRIDPDLKAHFDNESVEFNFFAYRWVNCFLMRELSLPLVVRLWDTYFAEDNESGFKCFHVYTCAAFLLSFSKELQTLDMEHIIWRLQNNPTATWNVNDLVSVLSEAFVLKTKYPIRFE